ncbi:hypothetical protein BGZ80_010361 [Entomortierella chlamydospora]|uniref:RNase III domain-containing protein n=1 Tax=Entomortierella chlamydospora TaxID=101097 RepID=A0A9P6MVT5_9FUNG|nr:hypothetical protein BGZ79_010288 [Entomortierella chlamydospora]KAG0014593.1 hypothetical protein BGZ80_010361 [Entomortierella chlamydospora]
MNSLKRPADQVVISPNVRRPRLTVEENSSAEPAISEEDQTWAQAQEEIEALSAASLDLYVCFLSAISLIRRHFTENDDIREKTALKFRTSFDVDAEKWECYLSHPSIATTFESGLFSHESTATCWAAFVACKELQLECPNIGSTVTNLPTDAIAYVGEKIMKMIYGMEGFVNMPHSEEGELTQRRDKKLCNVHLHSCAEDLAVATFFRGNSSRSKHVARFVRTVVGCAYYRGKMSLALVVVSGIIGPMTDIATWEDFAHLNNQIPSRRVPASIPKEEMEMIEGFLGYVFVRKAVIEEALTHESMPAPTENDATERTGSKAKSSYERLEFLGDAVLDFIAVMYWLERDMLATEGTLRKRIKESVNNKALGALCIELGLYKPLRHTRLYQSILSGKQAVEGAEKFPKYWNRLDIPKIGFADVIESIFGAILVDSRFNLQDTQRLFDRIVRPFCMFHFPTAFV